MQVLKNSKPIIVVSGEPYSVFNEILCKALSFKKIKKLSNPIILIGSKKLLIKQIKNLKIKPKINNINLNNLENEIIKKNLINIIDVNFKFSKAFNEISDKSTNYIKECFKIALYIKSNFKNSGIVNGPISKSHFKIKNFIGITEYLALLSNNKSKEVMLIYNNKLAVSPISTHIPLKYVSKSLSKDKIVYNVQTISKFYKNKLNKKKIKFGITGLNPHCESKNNPSEEKKIIIPAIKNLKRKGIDIKGPIAADTLFMKNIRDNYDVIIGMYHDQVLTPMKTIFEFNAINITLGLDFLRVSPDHGPNNKDLGKNISNPESLIQSLMFLDKLNAKKN